MLLFARHSIIVGSSTETNWSNFDNVCVIWLWPCSLCHQKKSHRIPGKGRTSKPCLAKNISFFWPINIKTIYPRGIGPTKELYSSSRQTTVVPLFMNYMNFFWLFTLKQRARIMVGLEHPTFRLRGVDLTASPPLALRPRWFPRHPICRLRLRWHLCPSRE